MTIIGDGLSDATIITLGAYQYTSKNAYITYGEISFTTSTTQVGNASLNLYVNGQKASCSDCNYQFSSIIAPTVLAVSPVNVNGPTTIIINGTQFGNDISNLTVNIGTQKCNLTSVSNTIITCFLSGLNVGQQFVNVNLQGTL